MNPKREYKGSYIAGHFIPVTDPIGVVPSLNPGDLDAPRVDFAFNYDHVNEAVLAARRAFKLWSHQDPAERYAVLQRYREILNSRREEIVQVDAFEIGKPLWEARLEVQDCLDLIDYSLNHGTQTSVEMKVPDAVPGAMGVVRYRSRGVLAVVSQSILPLISAHHHLIPALLNGNTIILKTTKHAPALGQLLAEIAHQAGVPAGCFNFLHGDGEVSRRLTGHPEIDGVLFTGTSESAIAIKKQLAPEYWKIAVLQSGGRNGTVIWDDANYSKALYDTVVSSFLTAGQRYTNGNRVIVHEKIFDRFLKDLHTLAKQIQVGYPGAEKEPFLGPLVSEKAIEDYVRYQGIALRENCEEVMRGKPLERDKKGYYVSPSIHLVETPDPKSVYQSTEFFGPNITLYKVRELDEARDILNITSYGLVASIYTGKRENFVRVTEDARVGMMQWNYPTTHLSFRMPVGGLKKSGNGRPMGSFAGYQCTFPISTVEAPADLASSFYPSSMPRLVE